MQCCHPALNVQGSPRAGDTPQTGTTRDPGPTLPTLRREHGQGGSPPKRLHPGGNLLLPTTRPHPGTAAGKTWRKQRQSWRGPLPRAPVGGLAQGLGQSPPLSPPSPGEKTRGKRLRVKTAALPRETAALCPGLLGRHLCHTCQESLFRAGAGHPGNFTVGAEPARKTNPVASGRGSESLAIGHPRD